MDVRWIILMFLATNAGISTADLALQPGGEQHAYFTTDNFVITCSARDKDTTELRWYGPSGDEITDRSGRIHIEHGSKQDALGLVWEEVQQEDAGMYKCTSNADDDEITFKLIVYGSINFANVDHMQSGKDGDNLTVECDADGEPKPSISWKFKGVSIPLRSDGLTPIKHETAGNKLKIYNLKREDAGNYTCDAMIVTDSASQIKDTNITVRVEYAPEWKSEVNKSAFSGVGHAVNLTCEANAEPSPIFEWKKNDETIQASSSYMIYNQNNKTILQILVHNESLFGDYECIAENPVGAIKRRIILEKGDAPSSPSLNVVSEEPGTLTLDIALPVENELEVIGYKVEYKLPSESWNNVRAIEFDRGHQYILKNLSHDTVYVVRVAARNVVGYGDYSNEITTRTKNISLDPTNESALSSQSSTIAALLSTSVSLWVLRL